MNRIKFFSILLVLAMSSGLLQTDSSLRADDNDGWITLFDGTSLDGWKASENKQSWKLEDKILICHGPRSHLFYMGEHAPFKNFELKVEVKAAPNSNSGIYFHTEYQEEGWPSKGFETQVNNTYNRDPRKTGSLYAVKDVTEQLIEDDTWWEQHVIVQGDRVIVKLNGKTAVDYTQPANAERRLGQGTFALQAHDPGSKVYFRSIKVKRLP
jgi:hypothetical protein